MRLLQALAAGRGVINVQPIAYHFRDCSANANIDGNSQTAVNCSANPSSPSPFCCRCRSAVMRRGFEVVRSKLLMLLRDAFSGSWKSLIAVMRSPGWSSRVWLAVTMQSAYEVANWPDRHMNAGACAFCVVCNATAACRAVFCLRCTLRRVVSSAFSGACAFRPPGAFKLPCWTLYETRWWRVDIFDCADMGKQAKLGQQMAVSNGSRWASLGGARLP